MQYWQTHLYSSLRTHLSHPPFPPTPTPRPNRGFPSWCERVWHCQSPVKCNTCQSATPDNAQNGFSRHCPRFSWETSLRLCEMLVGLEGSSRLKWTAQWPKFKYLGFCNSSRVHKHQAIKRKSTFEVFPGWKWNQYNYLRLCTWIKGSASCD